MSEFTSIHIFNPETDYALAVGNKIYNPPAKIVEFRRNNALIPASFAKRNDWIALIDRDASISDPVLSDAVSRKGIKVVHVSDLAKEMASRPDLCFLLRPWGWNFSLVSLLQKAGIPDSLILALPRLESLRALSHRRTAILFQRRLQTLLPGISVPIAREFADPDSAIDFLNRHGDAYFKLPWSSSGRGVIHAADFPSPKIKEWIAGGIRRQGSVIGENAFRRAADFATEWWIENGSASFLGLSFFRTSPEGRYLGNLIDSQDIISQKIAAASPLWSQDIIDAQKTVIDEIIAPQYSGPLGIDMLADVNGAVNPCVEINLRQTMGLAAILQYQNP